jgi:hypothetical protein
MHDSETALSEQLLVYCRRLRDDSDALLLRSKQLREQFNQLRLSLRQGSAPEAGSQASTKTHRGANAAQPSRYAEKHRQC